MSQVVDTIVYPEMRAEVVEALRALGDPDYQRRVWGRHIPGVSFYDDLDLNIHILYDDSEVLPDPAQAVPAILKSTEVSAVRAVDLALGPLIDELGNCPDADYLAHPGWDSVVEAATKALEVMTSPGA